MPAAPGSRWMPSPTRRTAPSTCRPETPYDLVIGDEAWDVDYYVFSFYKTYGPHFAVMYGKHSHLLELDGLYHYFYGRDKVPMKLEPGNTNYELAWGSAGIVDYLDRLNPSPDGARPPLGPKWM